jgi:phospho-N-acetylmuramoyl-pentapeptide-transferase
MFPVVSTGIMPATATTVPFFKFVIVNFAPWLYVAFVTFIVAGTSNGVNLSDGLDGLAAGLTAIAAAAFALFAYIFGRVDATAYLNLFYLPGAGELTVFLAALMGAALGFLWFNAHPAQVFMGDTGSLAIGGALGTVAILLKAEFLLAMIGGVFVAESVSVLVQTSVFKWLKRTRGREYAEANRVFRMAPLHHHFEKLGWAETTVVTRFYILGLFCALLALATLKLR